MTNFFYILKQKVTLGNVFTIIASFIFAVILRHLYLHLLDFLPIRGELRPLDISFFGLLVLFRFVFSALLEYLLNDKFNIPLFQVTGRGVGEKGLTGLNMVNSSNQNSSSENAPSAKNTATNKDSDREANRKFLDEQYLVGEKMWDVLSEQFDKISRLHSLKSSKNLTFHEENEGLDLTAPGNITDTEAEKISKEVGALDRALQNKFSEYKNLSSRDVRLYESMWTTAYKETWAVNQKQYKELFNNKKDI